MSHSAKVFLVEPSGICRMDVICALEKAGHEVVAVARDPEGAIGLIPHLSGLEVNVAIINGNLVSSLSNRGSDGQKVAEAIREGARQIKVVDHSAEPYGFGDIFVSKADNSREAIKALCEAVTRLLPVAQ